MLSKLPKTLRALDRCPFGNFTLHPGKSRGLLKAIEKHSKVPWKEHNFGVCVSRSTFWPHHLKLWHFKKRF